MNKFIGIFAFVLSTVKSIETALPDTPGKQKLDLLLGLGALAFNQEEEIRTAWGKPDDFAKAITNTATIAVNFLNAAGVFKKKDPATVAPVKAA